MRWSCLLSYTDHVPLETINKELSRHESNSQQAIIMEHSCEESCCSAGNNQVTDQEGGGGGAEDRNRGKGRSHGFSLNFPLFFALRAGRLGDALRRELA